MIIGLTGTLGAGKTEVANILKEKGFKHLSVREFLYEKLDERGLEHTRDNLVELANKLREKNSPSYLVEKLFEKANEFGGHSIIESIRTVGEVEALRKKGDFVLIAVDAEPMTRYKRAFVRGGKTDNISFDQFMKDEEREMSSNDSNKQNLKACIECADVKITNNGSLEELKKDVDKILEKFEIEKKYFDSERVGKRKDYISWDDYFMGVALLSAQRSKDPSTQTGACIVNPDNIIVGTGYNGFPIGCSDDSLPWAREGKPLETKYPFVCHGELNAILNSSTDLKNCRIYTPLVPCGECAKAIIQSGIKEVIYISDKHAKLDLFKAAKIMFDQAGIVYRKHVPNVNEIVLDFSEEKV